MDHLVDHWNCGPHTVCCLCYVYFAEKEAFWINEDGEDSGRDRDEHSELPHGQEAHDQTSHSGHAQQGRAGHINHLINDFLDP